MSDSILKSNLADELIAHLSRVRKASKESFQGSLSMKSFAYRYGTAPSSQGIIAICKFKIRIVTMKTSTILALASAVVPAAAFAPAKNNGVKSSLDVSKDEILKSPNTIEFGSIWDPLGLAEIGSEETLAWYRHSEVKHGRVAMAAFVGWWAVGAGVRFPGDLSFGQTFASIPSKGLEAWDAIPGWGKAQMLLFAGLIEFHDELFYSKRSTHYMRGGVPGKNMVPGLFDPFGLSKNKSEEALARGRDSEIKNGRLAMIGFMGLYAAATIQGSVPLQPPC